MLIQRFSSTEPAGNAVIAAVRDELRRERDQLFEKYLPLREDLVSVSAAIQSATVERRRNWSLLAASVALPSAFVVGLIAAERRHATARVNRPPKEFAPLMHAPQA